MEDELDLATLDRGDEVDVDPDNPDAELPTAKDEPKQEDVEAKKDSRIPLSRHKEILEKERAQRAELEAKAAELGIDVDGRWGDAKIAKLIADALTKG